MHIFFQTSGSASKMKKGRRRGKGVDDVGKYSQFQTRKDVDFYEHIASILIKKINFDSYKFSNFRYRGDI